MEHVPGGLGDKMEDWIEHAHQADARLRARFRTVKDPLVRAVARARLVFENQTPRLLLMRMKSMSNQHAVLKRRRC